MDGTVESPPMLEASTSVQAEPFVELRRHGSEPNPNPIRIATPRKKSPVASSTSPPSGSGRRTSPLRTRSYTSINGKNSIVAPKSHFPLQNESSDLPHSPVTHRPPNASVPSFPSQDSFDVFVRARYESLLGDVSSVRLLRQSLDDNLPHSMVVNFIKRHFKEDPTPSTESKKNKKSSKFTSLSPTSSPAFPPWLLDHGISDISNDSGDETPFEEDSSKQVSKTKPSASKRRHSASPEVMSKIKKNKRPPQNVDDRNPDTTPTSSTVVVKVVKKKRCVSRSLSQNALNSSTAVLNVKKNKRSGSSAVPQNSGTTPTPPAMPQNSDTTPTPAMILNVENKEQSTTTSVSQNSVVAPDTIADTNKESSWVDIRCFIPPCNGTGPFPRDTRLKNSYTIHCITAHNSHERPVNLPEDALNKVKQCPRCHEVRANGYHFVKCNEEAKIYLQHFGMAPPKDAWKGPVKPSTTTPTSATASNSPSNQPRASGNNQQIASTSVDDPVSMNVDTA